MPDRRRHRGAHPEDTRIFAADRVPVLRTATAELSWLLSRGYPTEASLKLVGDRHALVDRQRRAVLRSSCSDDNRATRTAKTAGAEAIPDATVWIDGFNVLTTVEAALGGGVLLRGRDGLVRDMASMHGNYRRVEETDPAIEAILRVLSGARDCRLLLDQPVSNSGRLAERFRAHAEARGVPLTVELVPDPDRELAGVTGLIASADSAVVDRAARVLPLAELAIVGLPTTPSTTPSTTPWLVDLCP